MQSTGKESKKFFISLAIGISFHKENTSTLFVTPTHPIRIQWVDIEVLIVRSYDTIDVNAFTYYDTITQMRPFLKIKFEMHHRFLKEEVGTRRL